MDEMIETAWRKALRAKGKEWVLSELHRRPGRPEDSLHDVVFTEPYPTRAFCYEWCAEEESRFFFRMSWHTYAAFAASVLLIVCMLKGISAWNDASLTASLRQSTAAAHGPSATAASGSSLTNDIPSTATSSDSGTTSGQNSPASICGYITYNTTRCKAQN